MPRFLTVGHVTWDTLKGRSVLGGTATYAACAARRLGWEAAVLTSAGPDFEAERDLPGVPCFVAPARATTRFQNDYDEAGERYQVLLGRSAPIDLGVLPDAWRDPDVLLLGPVAGEVPGRTALAFEAEVVGATAQGWLRAIGDDGRVRPQPWEEPGADLQGVHALVLSEKDVSGSAEAITALVGTVPFVLVTRGWRGLHVYQRDGVFEVPALPREEVDPTGAGDVFAAAFLLRYQETGDVLEAAAFGACAASCVVEAVGTSALGDRTEVLARMAQRERLLEEGEWD